MLKTWLVAAGLLTFLAACPGPKSSCSEDAQCSADARCDVDLGVCVTCAPDLCVGHLQCLRGGCAARYAKITILRPQAGVISPSAPLQARLELAPNATRSDPPLLTYAITDADGQPAASGQLALLQEGLYEGTWNAGSSTKYTLVVKYEDAGLQSDPVEFTIDSQPPTVELVVPVPTRRGNGNPDQADERDVGIGLNAWRRDENVTVTVRASEPLDLDHTVLVMTPNGGGAALTTDKKPVASTGCGQPFCATVALDMAEPAMQAFRLVYGLRISTADLAGNPAAATGTIRVTRRKWRFGVGADVVQTTPVVGGNGGVYFATSSGSNSIFAVNAAGIRQWATPLAVGSIQGSLSIQKSALTERLYFAAPTGGNVQVAAVDTSDGSGAVIGNCVTTGSAAAGSGAILPTAGTETFVTVIKDGTNATLLAYRRDLPIEAQRCERFTTSLRGIDFPGNIVASGTDVFFGDEQGTLQSFALASGWSARAGWPIANAFPRSLALSSDDVVGGMYDGLSQGRAFAAPKTGGAINWTFPGGVVFAFPAWSPSIGPSNRVLFSNENPTLTLVGLRQTTAVKELTTSLNVKAAPLFGQNGLIYTADEGGSLSTWDADLNLAWKIDLGVSDIQASPTIDCSRDNTGTAIAGRPGVLYVASMDGTLDAIIVDSKGIDVTAPWPKYQHDPRNTGNSATSLSEFVCP